MPAKWAKGPRGAAPTKTGASLAAAAAAKRRPVKLSAAVQQIGGQNRLSVASCVSAIYHILYVGVPIIPFNGQTTSNHTKLSTPSRSPLDFGVQMPLDMSNGSSIRAASGHQILRLTTVLYIHERKPELVLSAVCCMLYSLYGYRYR
jgi:hypothetical protein